MAPYTPTEQEQTLLQAYEADPGQHRGLHLPEPRGDPGPLRPDLSSGEEDGTWQNVDDIAVGSLLPPQAEGLITLQLEDSEAIIARVLCQGQPAGGKCRPPGGGTSSPGPRGSSPSPSLSSGTNPSPSPCWPTPRPGTPPPRTCPGQDLPPGLLHPGKPHRSGPGPGGDGDLLQRSLRKQAPAGCAGGGLPFLWFVGEVCFFCRSMV